MGRIVENLWDCQYCGTHGNRGRDYQCPNCGKTRDESVTFYLPNTITYYNKPIEEGPDWYCPYCNSYNKHSSNNCKNCGAERGNKNYFDIQKEKTSDIDLPKRQINPTIPIQYNPPIVNIKTSKNEIPKVVKKVKHKNIQWSWKRFIAIFMLLLIIGGIFAAIPKSKTITIETALWERQVEIQTNTLVEENDWSMPLDAVELLYTRREIHHYDHVIDHYETVTETKSRQVSDGYDTYYTYRDLGNGFSEEVEHHTPKYRTEYYTETHEEPVYRDDPVYRTKYYYTIWRYIYDHTETASGESTVFKVSIPKWPTYSFIGDQREGARTEIYKITYLNKKNEIAFYSVANLDLWTQLQPGKTYKVKISFGQIIQIDGRD